PAVLEDVRHARSRQRFHCPWANDCLIGAAISSRNSAPSPGNGPCLPHGGQATAMVSKKEVSMMNAKRAVFLSAAAAAALLFSGCAADSTDGSEEAEVGTGEEIAAPSQGPEGTSDHDPIDAASQGPEEHVEAWTDPHGCNGGC